MDRQFLTLVKHGDLDAVQEMLQISKKFGGTTTTATTTSTHHKHQHPHNSRRVLTIPQLLSVREGYGGPTALHLAVQNNHLELIRVLLMYMSLLQQQQQQQQQQQHGGGGAANIAAVNHVNSSTNDKTPLDLAYENLHADAATLLLENGGKTTFYSIPEYLLRAIQNNNPDMVRVILEKDLLGAKHVNHVYDEDDHNNNNNNNNNNSNDNDIQQSTTPLLMASEHGFANVVSILLKNGATVHANNKDGNTSLHLACIHGHYQVAKLLLEEHGAAIMTNDKNHTSFTPPMHLVESTSSGRHNAKNASSLLLQQRANLNIVNNDGLTPLVCAMTRGHYKLACLILEYEIELACLLLDTNRGNLEATTNVRGMLNVAAKGGRAINDALSKKGEEMNKLQQSQKRFRELLEKSKAAVDIPVEIVDAQQQERTTNGGSASTSKNALISSSSTTTTASNNESLLETLVSSQQHALGISAVTDNKMKRKEKLELLDNVLNEQVVHLEEESKHQQQKASVDSSIVHNIDNHDAISSIQQLLQTLVSQQKVGQESLEASLSTLMAAVSDKNHIETTVSALQERVAASASKENQLEVENVLLRQRLAHLEDQEQQQTAAASGICKLDNHVAVLNTTLLERYGQNALMAAVGGMKDIETNLVALQQSIAGFNVQDSREKNPASPNKYTFMKGRVASLEKRPSRLQEPFHPRHKSFLENCHDNINKSYFFLLAVLKAVVVTVTSMFTSIIPRNNTLVHGGKHSNEAHYNQGHSNNNEMSMLVNVVTGIDKKLACWLQMQQCQQETVNNRLTQEKKRSDKNKLKETSTTRRKADVVKLGQR